MPYRLCHTIGDTIIDGLPVGVPRQICVFLDQTFLPRLTPEPEPHFSLDGFVRQDIVDLQVLATIDSLSEHLSVAVSREIQHSVARHMEAVAERLGPSATLTRQPVEVRAEAAA